MDIMCHSIFIIDEEGHSDRVTSWITKLHPDKNNDDPSAEQNIIFNLIIAKDDFTKVCSFSASHSLDFKFCNRRFGKEEKQDVYQNNERTTELGAFLHGLADSFPCIGHAVQLYIFLRATDLSCEDSFTPLAGAVLRLSEWHNSSIVAVKLDSELSSFGDALVSLTDNSALSITKPPVPAPLSWRGSISVLNSTTNEGVVYPGFSFHTSFWTEIMKQTLYPPVKRNKGRKCKDQTECADISRNKKLCEGTIEVLQEIDLRTFPLFLLTPYFFTLHTLRNRNSHLLDYLKSENVCLLARLKVYHKIGDIPLCGNTDHLSTSAWKEHITASTSLSHFKSPQLSGCWTDHLCYDYLHLLIVRASNRLLVRVLMTSEQTTMYVISLSKQHNLLSLWHSQESNRDKAKEDADNEEIKNAFGTLPVFQADELYHTVRLLSEQQSTTLSSDRSGVNVEKQREEAMERMSRTNQTLSDLLKRVENLDTKKEKGLPGVGYSLSKCPEWIALNIEWSSRMETDSSLDNTSSPLVNSTGKDGSSQFNVDHLLSLFKDERGSMTSSSTGDRKLNEGQDLLFSLPTKASQGLSKETCYEHGVYQYSSQEDYQLEMKYADLRDNGSFQDTQSSFLSPKKKKSSCQQHAILPTRSSPRTKYFCQKHSSSQQTQARSDLKQTFKRPNQLSNDSISQPRKRLASSLTPEFDSNKPTSWQRKQLTSSLTPDLDSKQPVKCPRTSTPQSAHSKTPESSASTSFCKNEAFKMKRVPFTTVLDALKPSVSLSTREPSSSHQDFEESPKVTSQASRSTDSAQRRRESSRPSSVKSDLSAKMTRRERHMMKLKGIITAVLKEKGVEEGNPIHAACSKNLLNVSIILLKTLPNSVNLTNEMKSVVYEQVQQIINLEKRRSGIAI